MGSSLTRQPPELAHAGMKEAYQGRSSGTVREFALYGEATGEVEQGKIIGGEWAKVWHDGVKVDGVSAHPDYLSLTTPPGTDPVDSTRENPHIKYTIVKAIRDITDSLRKVAEEQTEYNTNGSVPKEQLARMVIELETGANGRTHVAWVIRRGRTLSRLRVPLPAHHR